MTRASLTREEGLGTRHEFQTSHAETKKVYALINMDSGTVSRGMEEIVT